jgi:hypothetical protein
MRNLNTSFSTIFRGLYPQGIVKSKEIIAIKKPKSQRSTLTAKDAYLSRLFPKYVII